MPPSCGQDTGNKAFARGAIPTMSLLIKQRLFTKPKRARWVVNFFGRASKLFLDTNDGR